MDSKREKNKRRKTEGKKNTSAALYILYFVLPGLHALSKQEGKIGGKNRTLSLHVSLNGITLAEVNNAVLWDG